MEGLKKARRAFHSLAKSCPAVMRQTLEEHWQQVPLLKQLGGLLYIPFPDTCNPHRPMLAFLPRDGCPVASAWRPHAGKSPSSRIIPLVLDGA